MFLLAIVLISICCYNKLTSMKQLRNHTLFSPHIEESGFPNPRNFCFWNQEFGKIMLLESGIGKVFLWNPESRALQSGTQLKESRTTLTIGIHSSSSTDIDCVNPVPGIQNLRQESRIHRDCLRFHYLELFSS